MSDDDWRFSADKSKTGWLSNKATIAKLKLGNLFRLGGLIMVLLTAYNFFSYFAFSFLPPAMFWPEMLLDISPVTMNALEVQFIAAIGGAIIVWFS